MEVTLNWNFFSGLLLSFGMDKYETNRKKIAERVAALLKERGWTQAVLAEKSGISKPRINVILKGNENLTIDTVTRLEVTLKAKIIEIH